MPKAAKSNNKNVHWPLSKKERYEKKADGIDPCNRLDDLLHRPGELLRAGDNGYRLTFTAGHKLLHG